MHHVVVHAHCYQPPREDPWLEVVETEASAAPDHDWNARIDRECYARLASAELRVRDEHAAPDDLDARAGLARLVNLYGWCTFDVGATLCEWMDRHAPDTLAAMVAGDRASVRRWGHGNAIAAPYHHVILPLASLRDRRTEVRWGIKDFARRFGRAPEGMWLPECAADEDTLDLLAAEGIRFTILAPYQVRTSGEHHGLPVRWRGASGRSLAILPYDGGLAGEVAFGGLLRDADALARRLAPSIGDGQHRCTTLATDGETFGHHHRNGERTLAAALARMARRADARITNAATMVAQHPPTLDAQLVSPSAWSCAHGVERWRSNCGCRLDGSKPPAQQWRGPLREALTALAEQLGAAFEHEGAALFAGNPWDVRDEYGAVVAFDGETLATHVRAALRPEATQADLIRARELLEMQRASLRMLTSCAWFFDEVDRIETRQVLRYAARALQLMHATPTQVEAFASSLNAARANPSARSANDVWTRAVWPRVDAAVRVAAGAMALHDVGVPFEFDRTLDGSFDFATVARDSAHAYRATVHDRRTGREEVIDGVVEHGNTSSLAIRIDGSADALAIQDLPEPLAMALLRPRRDADDALS